MLTILTTRVPIPVVTNDGMAGLVADPQRGPIDAADVAHVPVAGNDNVTSTDLDQ